MSASVSFRKWSSWTMLKSAAQAMRSFRDCAKINSAFAAQGFWPGARRNEGASPAHGLFCALASLRYPSGRAHRGRWCCRDLTQRRKDAEEQRWELEGIESDVEQ